MKHKKLIVVLVVVALAITASIAYAWWSSTVTSDTNTVTTGNVALAMQGLPIDASGLMPQTDPAAGADDAAYGDVTYISVQNNSTVPLMFYGWLSDGSDPDNIRSYVKVRIELLGSAAVPAYWTGYTGPAGTFQDGGPYPVFTGTVAQLWGESYGINYLSSRYWTGSTWVRTPFEAGELAVYRVAVWLDSAAPNTAQNDALGFKVNFTGMQIEAWDAASYDSTDFVP